MIYFKKLNKLIVYKAAQIKVERAKAITKLLINNNRILMMKTKLNQFKINKIIRFNSNNIHHKKNYKEMKRNH